jgi:hypothetical protein
MPGQNFPDNYEDAKKQNEDCWEKLKAFEKKHEEIINFDPKVIDNEENKEVPKVRVKIIAQRDVLRDECNRLNKMLEEWEWSKKKRMRKIVHLEFWKKPYIMLVNKTVPSD